MAEPQETQQEKEARWATHRASRDTQQKNWRAARARTRVGSWLVVGVVVIVAFIAVIMLL